MTNLLTAEDFAPFERVAICRLRDARGEPTEWVDIVALRDGAVYHAKVHYADLWDQMAAHMEWQHGKRLDDPMTPQELAHAIIRAAIIMLCDQQPQATGA